MSCVVGRIISWPDYEQLSILEIRDRKVDLTTDCGKIALKAGAIFFKYTPASFIMGIGFAAERIYRAVKTDEKRDIDSLQIFHAQIELISGLVSLIPFVGPLASIAIDVFLTREDFNLASLARLCRTILDLDSNKYKYTQLEVDIAFLSKLEYLNKKCEEEIIIKGIEPSEKRRCTQLKMLVYARKYIYQEQGWTVPTADWGLSLLCQGLIGEGLQQLELTRKRKNS